ncbi:uncharacterized protein N7500_009984 [Penicillium coprophilum]|uniref:uncharacterized protein n=1 Tax=Penicillium coprophilum TaxID=36646 RepID=UPI0023973ACA|nr:uncharacterized protein N7500_009984 [Penicillium coprophilum]KAJ5154545.1 hypothetical protein N7500_009984 [Penicillium coprophilum]
MPSLNIRLRGHFTISHFPEQKMGGKSRNEAVLDAVMKANQHAKAVGFDTATPTDIKELEAQPASPSGYLQRPIYRHSSGVSLTPQDILIYCCLEISFECVSDLGSTDRSGNTPRLLGLMWRVGSRASQSLLTDTVDFWIQHVLHLIKKLTYTQSLKLVAFTK